MHPTISQVGHETSTHLVSDQRPAVDLELQAAAAPMAFESDYAMSQCSSI